MKYLNLTDQSREELIQSLQSMENYLGEFSPVEQVWHLADLEREGFGERISKIIKDNSPFLPNFDGDRIAKERNYKSRTISDGLTAFSQARSKNLRTLLNLQNDQWERKGTQEGIGEISLCDIPYFMSQRDLAHKREIAQLLESI